MPGIEHFHTTEVFILECVSHPLGGLARILAHRVFDSVRPGLGLRICTSKIPGIAGAARGLGTTSLKNTTKIAV
jgi:hypothetical protein